MAGSVAATGPISLPLSALRTILSNCAQFQTWTSTANAAAALAKIYLVATPLASISRPFAWISHRNGIAGLSLQRDQLTPVSGSTEIAYAGSGSLVLGFEANLAGTSGFDAADEEFTFTNAIGQIIKEMFILSGRAGYMNLEGVQSLTPPQRSHPDESSSGASSGGGSYIRHIFAVNWRDYL